MPLFRQASSRNWRAYGLILAMGGVFLLLVCVAVVYESQPAPQVNAHITVSHATSPTPTIVRAPAVLSPIHLPILMYHYVEVVQNKRDTMRIRLAVTPALLEEQLQMLTKDGYHFYLMRDVPALMAGSGSDVVKKAILTFDDGYRDFYVNAYPLLKKYSVKATLYLISHKLNTGDFLTDAQVKEMLKSGLIEVGAHTLDHDDLALLGPTLATEQIAGSKKDLEQRYGVPVTTFAYPSGEYNDETVRIVKDAGFVTAVTTHPGTELDPHHMLTLTRIRPGSMTGEKLLDVLKEDFIRKAVTHIGLQLRALLLGQ